MFSVNLILIVVVEVQLDEDLLELSLDGQITQDLEQMAVHVSVVLTDLSEFLLGTEVMEHINSVLLDQEEQFEHHLEDLVQISLHPVLGLSKEAFVKDVVQELVVALNQFFEVIDLGELFLEVDPLGLDNVYHDILIQGLDEEVHLLTEELDLSQLFEVSLVQKLNSIQSVKKLMSGYLL